MQELCEVSVPHIKNVWPLEESDSLLVSLESLFKIVLFFEEQPIIDDDLGAGDFQLQYSVVNSFGGLERDYRNMLCTSASTFLVMDKTLRSMMNSVN